MKHVKCGFYLGLFFSHVLIYPLRVNFKFEIVTTADRDGIIV